jgi:hypothetical protein
MARKMDREKQAERRRQHPQDQDDLSNGHDLSPAFEKEAPGRIPNPPRRK